MSKTILCVEDEIEILENNRKVLTNNGYTVLTAETLAEARAVLAKTTPDIVVLDVMLPDGNGLEYLKELRAEGNEIPIIMLTAWNRSYNIAYGLNNGADDYIGKPFEYEVLLARIKKVLAQSERVPKKITRGALSLDPISGQAYLNGGDLLLAKKEFALLLLFIQNEDKTMSADYLYEKIWGQSLNENKRALENAISRLRKSIEPSDYDIITKRGQGYVFEKE